ncbi:MAG: MoaD/ThiS family protein [Candidatus Hodarchaeota archaeon]
MEIKQLSELLETGIYETFKPEKRTTVRDLLKELNLEGKYFGILVNSKKATEDTVIHETDEVIILPHIAGGR